MSIYDDLNNNPGVENLFPVFIAEVAGVRSVIANVVEGVVYLTDAGKAFLEASPPTVSKRAAKSKPASQVDGAIDVQLDD